MTIVAHFEIEYRQCLDEDGKLVDSPGAKIAGAEDVLAMYRLMVLTRAFDYKAIALQRTGQLGTYAASLGQEAIGAAVGLAMREEDVLAPTYREQAAQFARGVTMTDLLRYWGGDERGSDFEGPRHDFPVCVPIGTQSCHAVGAACAFKIRQEPRVSVCMAGDGATSRGDVYESMNLAGVWRLPVVFVINNNQWAISLSRAAQTAAETLAQKAIAAGFDGIQVDGNDVLALRWTIEEALARARNGDGPTLIEGLTYRMHDHTTADDASRYRPEKDLEIWKKRDPLIRTRAYLESLGAWSAEDEARLAEESAAEVDAAVQAYLATPAQGPESMFDYLYETLPARLEPQRRAALEDDAGHG